MNWLNKCHFGDVREVLRAMIAAGVKVQCIVTSPPYWALRDYGHDGQFGLEPTFAEWLSTQVEVFELAKQVLADDGTCWVNMGDSYVSSGGSPTTKAGGRVPASWTNRAQTERSAIGDRRSAIGDRRSAIGEGLKPKDMVGQPWRLAFALQDAGWYLRQDIIWHKPNPMPESIKDRCTKAHEYLFLLSKSARYHFDFEAFQEPVNGGAHARRSESPPVQPITGEVRRRPGNGVGFGHGYDRNARDRGRQSYKSPDGWNTAPGSHGSIHPDGREKGRVKNNDSFNGAMAEVRSTRNRRSVWTIATEPYLGAHFATFPTKLVEPCILAGCPMGGTVLDIYFGSGTTGQVAQALGRNFIGIEINTANRPLQDERLRQQSLNLEAALQRRAA